MSLSSHTHLEVTWFSHSRSSPKKDGFIPLCHRFSKSSFFMVWIVSFFVLLAYLLTFLEIFNCNQVCGLQSDWFYQVKMTVKPNHLVHYSFRPWNGLYDACLVMLFFCLRFIIFQHQTASLYCWNKPLVCCLLRSRRLSWSSFIYFYTHLAYFWNNLKDCSQLFWLRLIHLIALMILAMLNQRTSIVF